MNKEQSEVEKIIRMWNYDFKTTDTNKALKNLADIITDKFHIIPKTDANFIVIDKRKDSPDKWVEEVLVSTCPLGTDIHKELKWKEK